MRNLFYRSQMHKTLHASDRRHHFPLHFPKSQTDRESESQDHVMGQDIHNQYHNTTVSTKQV
jgi:hypothetical protein